jgi:hypothetical protein
MNDAIPSEQSRRDLVRGAVAAGAASAIPFLAGVRTAFAQADSERAVLEAAIGLEQRAVLASEASGRAGVADVIAEQDREHVAGLSAALRDLGGKPPPGPERPDDVPGLVAALRGGPDDYAAFAIELKTTAVAAYYDAHAKLETPDLLGTVASIMANEAQHLVVLRQELGRNPSPEAFVRGQ